MCEECRVEIEGSPYCSFDCHEKAKEASVRMDRIRAEEAAAAQRRKQKRFYVNSFWIIAVVALVISWPHLPKGLTEPIMSLIQTIKNAFTGGK